MHQNWIYFFIAANTLAVLLVGGIYFFNICLNKKKEEEFNPPSNRAFHFDLKTFFNNPLYKKKAVVIFLIIFTGFVVYLKSNKLHEKQQKRQLTIEFKKLFPRWVGGSDIENETRFIYSQMESIDSTIRKLLIHLQNNNEHFKALQPLFSLQNFNLIQIQEIELFPSNGKIKFSTSNPSQSLTVETDLKAAGFKDVKRTLQSGGVETFYLASFYILPPDWQRILDERRIEFEQIHNTSTALPFGKETEEYDLFKKMQIYREKEDQLEFLKKYIVDRNPDSIEKTIENLSSSIGLNSRLSILKGLPAESTEDFILLNVAGQFSKLSLKEILLFIDVISSQNKLQLRLKQISVFQNKTDPQFYNFAFEIEQICSHF